jgi:hypothetical protein
LFQPILIAPLDPRKMRIVPPDQTSSPRVWLALTAHCAGTGRGRPMDKTTKHEVLIITLASLAPIPLLTGAVMAILL